MAELARYVVGLGHREIGLLTMRLGSDRPPGDGKPMVASPDRRARRRISTCSGNGSAACPTRWSTRDWIRTSLTVVESYEHQSNSGGQAAEVALDVNPRLTALICTADVLAVSAMDYLRARGIYVPGQMTVTGFDGVPEALRRGLTTV